MSASSLIGWLKTPEDGLVSRPWSITSRPPSRALEPGGGLDAARLGRCCGHQIGSASSLRFRPPKKIGSLTEILDALEEVGPRLSFRGRSVLGFCAITGQRASFFFSMTQLSFPGVRDGNPILGRDTKRNRLAETTPTMEVVKYVGCEPDGWREPARSPQTAH